MGIIEQFPYIKTLLVWMVLPVIAICLILVVIALKMYQKHKYNLTFSKRRTIKLILNGVGILFLAAIFILMLAFINVFVEKAKAYDLKFTNQVTYYIILLSPLLPFMFLFNFVVNFFKTLKLKEKKVHIDKNEKFDINTIEKFDFNSDDKKTDENEEPEIYSAKNNNTDEEEQTDENEKPDENEEDDENEKADENKQADDEIEIL